MFSLIFGDFFKDVFLPCGSAIGQRLQNSNQKRLFSGNYWEIGASITVHVPVFSLYLLVIDWARASGLRAGVFDVLNGAGKIGGEEEDRDLGIFDQFNGNVAGQ